MRKLMYSMLVAGALLFAATACERDADELNPNPPAVENPDDDPENPENPTPGEPAVRFYVAEGCAHEVGDWSAVEWTAVAAPDYGELYYDEERSTYEGLLKVEWANCEQPAYEAPEWLTLTDVSTKAAEAVEDTEIEWSAVVYDLQTEGLDLHGASGNIEFAYGEGKTAVLTIAAGVTPHTLAAFAAEGGIDDWLSGRPAFSENPVDGVLELVYDEYDDAYYHYFRLEGRNLEGVEVVRSTDPEEAYWLEIMELGGEEPYYKLTVDGASEEVKECKVVYTCDGGEALLSFKVVVPAVEVKPKVSVSIYTAQLTEDGADFELVDGKYVFGEQPAYSVELFWDGSRYVQYVLFECENFDGTGLTLGAELPEGLTISKYDGMDNVAQIEAKVSRYDGIEGNVVLNYEGEYLTGFYVEGAAFPEPVFDDNFAMKTGYLADSFIRFDAVELDEFGYAPVNMYLAYYNDPSKTRADDKDKGEEKVNGDVPAKVLVYYPIVKEGVTDLEELKEIFVAGNDKWLTEATQISGNEWRFNMAQPEEEHMVILCPVAADGTFGKIQSLAELTNSFGSDGSGFEATWKPTLKSTGGSDSGDINHGAYEKGDFDGTWAKTITGDAKEWIDATYVVNTNIFTLVSTATNAKHVFIFRVKDNGGLIWWDESGVKNNLPNIASTAFKKWSDGMDEVEKAFIGQTAGWGTIEEAKCIYSGAAGKASIDITDGNFNGGMGPVYFVVAVDDNGGLNLMGYMISTGNPPTVGSF